LAKSRPAGLTYCRRGFLQLVAVFPAEAVAGVEVGSTFVVFPNLVVLRLAWPSAQRALFEDIALSVTIQFQEARCLGAAPAIGENDQYLALHCGGQYGQAVCLPPPFSSSGSWAISGTAANWCDRGCEDVVCHRASGAEVRSQDGGDFGSEIGGCRVKCLKRKLKWEAKMV
jgi:hypothetical protein